MTHIGAKTENRKQPPPPLPPKAAPPMPSGVNDGAFPAADPIDPISLHTANRFRRRVKGNLDVTMGSDMLTYGSRAHPHGSAAPKLLALHHEQHGKLHVSEAIDYLMPEAPPRVKDLQCTSIQEACTVQTDVEHALGGEPSARPQRTRVDYKSNEVIYTEEDQSWAASLEIPVPVTL